MNGQAGLIAGGAMEQQVHIPVGIHTQIMPKEQQRQNLKEVGIGIKQAKTVQYETTGEPISLKDIVETFYLLYPEESFQLNGSLKTGLVLTSNQDPVHLLAIKGQPSIPQGYTLGDNGRVENVIFNGTHRASHIESSMMTTATPQMVRSLKKLSNALRTAVSIEEIPESVSRGWGGVGTENEFFLIHPETGELMPVSDQELLDGLIEVDDGVHLDPVNMAGELANQRVRLERQYPEALLVNTCMPPAGSPQNTQVNNHGNNGGLGKYVAAVEKKLFSRYKPRTDETKELYTKLSKYHGYHSIEEMISQHGDTRTWGAAATHISTGHQNHPTGNTNMPYQVNAQEATNMANIALSRLGTVLEIIGASGPYFHNVIAEINGQPVPDARQIARDMMPTTKYANTPFSTPQEYSQNVVETITTGQADRLARAAIVHITPDRRVLGTAHGSGRMRVENTRQKTGRFEFTGASGNGGIREKARMMSFMQILNGIATTATAENKDSLVAAGELGETTPEEIWGGDTREIVMDYQAHGSSSERVIKVLQMSKKVIQGLNIRALNVSREVALAALEGLSSPNRPTSLEEFSQTGNGTLGEVLVNYAQKGYTGLQIAHLMHAYQNQESEQVRQWNPHERKEYLLGKRGFNFLAPDISQFGEI